jgi:hypothetical protein
MKKQSQSRLASILLLLVGLWVLLSPIWVAVSGAAFANVIVVGIIMIITSAIQLFLDNTTIPSWVNGVLAAWLLVSAFVFGVGAGAMASQIISAILAFVFAYWDGVEISEMHQIGRRPTA